MDIDGEADPVPPALRDDSNDPGWKYGKYCDPNNKTKVKCDFCGHISTGGIYRFKQHVAATDNCVKPCKKATPEAIAECKNYLNHDVESKSTKRQRYQDLTDDVHVSSGTTYDTSRDDVCVGSSSSDSNKLGPMDKFVRPIDGKSSKEEALRQLSMNEALFKERVHQVSQYLARWVYTHAIPFDALDNDEFKQMCEAIGKFGPGYEPPSQSELREKLLSEEWFKKADDSVIDNDSKEEKEHAQMEIRTATGSSFVEELDHMSLQERYKILLANKRSSAAKEISSALSIIGSMDADNNVSLLGEIPLDTQISSVECIVNGKKIPCDPACLVDVKMEPALDGYAIYPSESPCVSEKVLEEDADKNDEGIAYPSRRRRKKKTATDSIETALEEDAPGLLQILLDKGIVVKEIKLYDVGEDNEMIADCTESDFQDLENVIAKLFPQRASLLKSVARHAGGGKAIYCLACLISLIEQSRYLQFRHCPVEWGWCRDLQSFIFVFRSHNRLVLERPEYGYATYFFEIVQSVPVEWQIRRLVTAMKLSSCGRTALIENRPLLVGEDLTEGEAKVLEEYGWIPSTGLGTMLNYRDRVVHDRWNEKYSTDWRMKIGRLLMNGYSEGNLIIPHGPTKMLSEEEIKLEEI